MPLILNSDKLTIVVKPEQNPLVITGYTPTVITGSGSTTVINPSPNNFVVYSPASVLPTVLIGSGNTQTQNVSGNTWIIYSSGGTGGGTWGGITGTLSDQTDLQLALDDKLYESVYQADMLIISDEIDGLISGQTTQAGQISTLQSDVSNKVDNSVYQADMVIIGGEIDDNYNAFTGHTSDLSIHQTKTILQGSGNTSVNNVSGNTWVIYSSGSTGGGTWGSITGTLSGQTDLWQELNLKVTKLNFDSHSGDTTIHYKMSGITIGQSQVTGLATTLAGKTNTGTTYQLRQDFNSHSGNTTIHQTKTILQGSGNTQTTNVSGNTWVVYSSGSTLPALLPSRALITNMSSGITTANTTSTEIGYLYGVTSGVQSQINGKAASNHTHEYTGSTILNKPSFVGSGNTDVTLSGNTYVIYSPTGSTAPAWGGITGTLSNQTDLQTALDAKSTKIASVTAINTNTQIDATFSNQIVEVTAVATVTLPTGLGTGFQCTFVNTTTATTTFAAGSGATIVSKGGNLKLASQWGAVSAYYNGTSWRLIGDLLP